MKKLQSVLRSLLIVALLQLTLLSCSDNSEIINNQNVEQNQGDIEKVTPSHAGGGGDATDDEEDGY